MHFKKCSCGKSWASRKAFLADNHIEVVGYQVDFEDLKAGFFLFNHKDGKCQTTLSIAASHFLDLYDGPMFKERLEDTQTCGRMCFHSGNLERCPAKCECAFVREVLHVVSEWKKSADR